MSEQTPEVSSPESAAAPDTQGGVAWERELLNRLAFSALAEQRRARRWSVFFKFAVLAYLVLLVVLYLPEDWAKPASAKQHTALVEVEGVIAAGGDASADKVIGALREAFEDERTAGVVVRINSPGGSPVQAGYINDEIVRLRKKYPDIPLYAVVADTCASGGYYVAAAADKIYADKSSVVGSIGVLMNGFGFVGTMELLGVERRLLTAGEHKGLMDPFSPAKSGEVEHIQTLLDEMHRQFIEVVKRGRGERLKGGEELFSGLVWTGEKALELGLVDELGSASYVAREVVGEEEIVEFTHKRDYLERIADRIGAAMGSALGAQLGIGGAGAIR